MPGHEGLAAEFEGHRPHLRGVAYRLLGSTSEAQDVVQEYWTRLSRSDTANVGGKPDLRDASIVRMDILADPERIARLDLSAVAG